MSARVLDDNGYIEIDNNPISRTGVFQYMGSTIDADAEPDKVYNVYRPEEELNNPECIKSFQLLPIIDDHEMLGAGFTAPEQKGVHGTTGEAVSFRDGVLYSKLRIFSESLASLIESGKKDLSLGYRCMYEKAKGTFNGESYDYIQRQLRGNHLALVDQARCAVSVLDHNITFDHLDISTTRKDTKMENEKETQDAPATNPNADTIAKLKGVIAILEAADAPVQAEIKEEVEDVAKAAAAVEGDEDKAPAASDSEGEEDKPVEDEANVNAKQEALGKALDAIEKLIGKQKPQAKAANGMDAKAMMGELSRRNKLASELSAVVGTFDHDDMTHEEVAAYGVQKIGLDSAKGEEVAIITGYLAGVKSKSKTAAMDAKPQTSSLIDAHINGSK